MLGEQIDSIFHEGDGLSRLRDLNLQLFCLLPPSLIAVRQREVHHARQRICCSAALLLSTVPDSSTSTRGLPCSSACPDVPPGRPSSPSPRLEPPAALAHSNIRLQRTPVHNLCIARHRKPSKSPAGHRVDWPVLYEERVFDGMYNLHKRRQDRPRMTIDCEQKISLPSLFTVTTPRVYQRMHGISIVHRSFFDE